MPTPPKRRGKRRGIQFELGGAPSPMLILKCWLRSPRKLCVATPEHARSENTKGTLHEMRGGRQCPPNQPPMKDTQLCNDAVREISGARDQAAKLAVLKKAITERDAPTLVVEDAIVRVFQ